MRLLVFPQRKQNGRSRKVNKFFRDRRRPGVGEQGQPHKPRDVIFPRSPAATRETEKARKYQKSNVKDFGEKVKFMSAY
jgi:hypothetical protein